METLVRKKYGLLFLITCLISYQVKSVNGNPTFHDYQNATCPDDTIKCPPSADCCLKDSQVCSKWSDICENVFKPGEDKHDTCCTALRKNDTTREGLIEVCKYFLGSSTWQENCKAIYTGEPKGEPPSTTAETKPPPTVAPTQLQQEQVTPSSEKPKGEPPSTTAGTKPPTTGPTQQQQKEQVTPSSEASGDGKFSAGIGIGIVIGIAICLVVVALICVVIAYKLTRKGSFTICWREVTVSVKRTSTEPERTPASDPLAQQEKQAFIDPKSGSEPREDVNEDNPLWANTGRRLKKALNS